MRISDWSSDVCSSDLTSLPAIAARRLSAIRSMDSQDGPAGRWIWDDMEEASENRVTAIATALLRALQPAIPAVIGAAALTFLFAALMLFSWVVAVGVNIFLDRKSIV